MKKFLNKTTALSAGIIFSVFGFFTETFWNILPWFGRVKDWNKWNDQDLSLYIQDLIIWFLGFLALIAVIIFIVAWFMIMTAWDDEEKVKKGKAWMINAVIWIIVIFLAWSVTKWIFDIVMWTAVGQG